jgi:hypothetical protein
MELEWQKIKVELAKRIDAFLDQLGNDETGIDSSVCGYFPEDIALRMAESATNVLQASAAGQRYLREQEIESA